MVRVFRVVRIIRAIRVRVIMVVRVRVARVIRGFRVGVAPGNTLKANSQKELPVVGEE